MFVAIFPSLEGDSLEDASIRLAEQWKVGHKGPNNGVILLVFLKEHKLRIEVGYGLEPVITDAVAATIIRDVIAPRFREQRYAAGLDAAIDEVFARITGTAPPRSTRAPAHRALDPTTLAVLALIFGVFVVAIGSAMRSSVRRGYTVDRGGWRAHPPIFWGGGGWGGGGGSWGGGGGGGGFSGGGGGSFGGGGASGDW